VTLYECFDERKKKNQQIFRNLIMKPFLITFAANLVCQHQQNTQRFHVRLMIQKISLGLSGGEKSCSCVKFMLNISFVSKHTNAENSNAILASSKAAPDLLNK
jgi:hypothetical protein